MTRRAPGLPHTLPTLALIILAAGRGGTSAGTYHTTTVKKDGTLWTWGYNDSGPLGDGTKAQHHSRLRTKGPSAPPRHLEASMHRHILCAVVATPLLLIPSASMPNRQPDGRAGLVPAITAALQPTPQDWYCEIELTMRNRHRFVYGSVSTECTYACPPADDSHPFGNWGADTGGGPCQRF